MHVSKHYLMSIQLVRIDTIVKAELDEIGKKKETYSDIIKRLLEQSREVNQSD